MKKLFTFLFPFISLLLSCTGEKEVTADPYYLRMAESEMQRYPESWMVDFSEKIKWNYTHGLELQAMIQVSEKSGDEKYFRYAEAYADTMVNEDGTIKTYVLENTTSTTLTPVRCSFQSMRRRKTPST